MRRIEVDRLYKLSKEIEFKFNGSLYLVRHKDISAQYIGSGSTLDKALCDAEETRSRLLSTQKPPKGDTTN